MKNSTLHIIGAGTLGQHIAHYVLQLGIYNQVAFFDDDLPVGTCNDYGTVTEKTKSIEPMIKSGEIQNLLIGIGYKHMYFRNSLFQKYCQMVNFPNIIHPSVYIDKSVVMGKGIVILPGCVIDKGTVLGDNIFLNPGVVLAHDNIVKANVFFAPGVKTSGFITIGSNCFIGTGSTMVNNISICDNVIIGAGATVTKSIELAGTYAGNPAKPLFR